MNYNLELRKINPLDFVYINKWYKLREQAEPNQEFLPKDTGYIIYNKEQEKPICALWIYLTNSPIVMFEEVISDPTSNKDIRSDALDLLFESCLNIVKKQGFQLVMGIAHSSFLLNRLKKHGFDLIGDNVIQYAKIINNGGI